MQRSYTSEYRENAVKLAKELGTSAAARELKIPSDTLYTWVARAKSGTLPPGPKKHGGNSQRNLAERVRELEQENKMLQSEVTQISLQIKSQ